MDHSVFLDHPKSRSKLCVPYRRDARLIVQWLNDPEVRQYLMRYAPLALEGEEKWLAQIGENTSGFLPVTHAMLLIVEKVGNKRIGTMGLHNIDWRNRHAVTGTLIGAKQYQSKGYGTDAKMLLLDWAFNELNLNKVESRVVAFNERSLRYARKCGYEEVGRLKRHVFRHGQYHDEIILEVHADPWRALWKRFEAGTLR